MSVRMSILAMLAKQPSYGYLLRAEFDRRTGGASPLNVGQVYKALDLLERDGLVTRSDHTDDDGHIFYEATTAGLTAVDEWLVTAEPTATPNRNDLAVKVAVATTLPGVDVGRMLGAQRQAALARLQRLTRAIKTKDAPLSARLVADAVLFEAETELRWLDHVEQRIRGARASGDPLEVAFDLDPPRRGRPSKSAGTPALDPTPPRESASTAEDIR